MRKIIRIKAAGRAEVEAKYLSRGKFTVAYFDGELVWQFVDGDPMKEAIWMFAPPSQHIPTVDRETYVEASYVDGNKPVRFITDRTYTMPFYQPLNRACGPAWEQFKRLQDIRQEAFIDCCNVTVSDPEYSRMFREGFLDRLERSDLPASLFEAFDAMVAAGRNYSDSVMVEIAKRNMKVDNDGNLVLLDVLFIPDTYRQAWA